MRGHGQIRAANGDQARFGVGVETTPAKGTVWFTDGEARSFKVRSTSIIRVDIDIDAAQATILGKATINEAGSFDFRVDVRDLPRAPDTFRLRLGDYDSGEQPIHEGGVDIQCGDGEHDGKGGNGTDNGKGKTDKVPHGGKPG